MHSQSVWDIYYIILYNIYYPVTPWCKLQKLDGFGLGAPPRAHPYHCRRVYTNRSPSSGFTGFHAGCGLRAGSVIFQSSIRALGMQGNDFLLIGTTTLASSCRQGRGLDANRVTVMVVLATRRRLAPCWSADEQSQRPSHSCTRRVRVLWIHPTFQCASSRSWAAPFGC